MKLADIDARGHEDGQFKTFCPLCHEGRKHQSDPSLAVNLDDGVYNCHHCGESGLLDEYKGRKPLGFASKQQKAYAKPDGELLWKETGTLDPKVVEYFANRGITEPTLSEWRVSYGNSFPEYTDYTDEMGRNIVKKIDGIPVIHKGIRFPYFERGQLVTVKHILPVEWSWDGERHFKAFKGGKPVPFGLDRVRPNDMLVITEGEIDALSVYEAGHQIVWSVPSGSQSLNWLEFDSVVEALEKTSIIVLAVDKDFAGRELEAELIRRLSLLVGLERLQVATFPDDCKDANDVLVQYGPKVLYDCIEDAIPVPIDGISEADEFLTEFLDFFNNGLPRGFSTGIPTLDQIYRVMPGMVTVLTGVPSHGKSEFLDEVVRLMAETHDWKFAFYTPENTPTSLHMIKLAEKYIGKPFDRDKYGSMTEDEAIQAAAWMKDTIFYINPHTTTYSVEEILERAKILVYRKGIRGLIIDPWNYVRKDFGPLREDQFINQELQKIGMFAKATGVHIWLVVHPRTLRKDKEGKIAVPNMYDLSGGSKFGDNADFILAVSRDPTKAFETGIHEVTVHNQKARYRPAGTQGHVTLFWEPFNGRFNAGADAVIQPPDDNMEIIEDGF